MQRTRPLGGQRELLSHLAMRLCSNYLTSLDLSFLSGETEAIILQRVIIKIK